MKKSMTILLLAGASITALGQEGVEFFNKFEGDTNYSICDCNN